MIEKIKELDFSTLSTEDTDILVTEMIALSDDELKENVNTIIDTIDYKYTSEDENTLFPSYDTIFGNDRIKEVLNNLLKEYEEND